MGRNKLTEAEKVLRGNLGKRDAPPEVGIEIPKLRVPSILSKTAQKYWRTYAPLLVQIGSLTKLSVPTFIEYCRIKARLDQIHLMVDKHPSMLEETKWVDSSGQEHTKLKEAEYFKMMRKLSADALRHERALRMTPDRMAGTYKPKPQSKAQRFRDRKAYQKPKGL